MKPWELTWHEFELPHGLRAQYAIDGDNIQMMVDDDDVPEGMSVESRIEQCYYYFFTFIWQK
jgi:hypothetical protein